VVRGVDLLLVVTGTITREYQTGESVRRVRAATLTPGLRYHLHMHALAASPELDPDGFDFQGGEEAASAWLRLRAWVERVARGVRRDEGFRWLTPALAPAPRAPLAQALGSGAARGRESLLLDNLAQFRAYSGWRSALERRLSRR
jgi:hypothetical protein